MEVGHFIAEHFSAIISGAGALGSVIAAWIAFLQFRRAAASADLAIQAESRVLGKLRASEMSRDNQKIADIVERLSRHTQRGKLTRKAGVDLSEDIVKAITLCNEFSASPTHSGKHHNTLSDIRNAATSIDFQVASDQERVNSLNTIIEGYSSISVLISKEEFGDN